MKTVIFFLALVFSFYTILSVISRYAEFLVSKKSKNMFGELLLGDITIALWIFLYYLTNL